MERELIEAMVDRAASRFGEAIADNVLVARIAQLEAKMSVELKALYDRIHDVRSGTPMSPGLNGHTLSIRELEMKQDQLRIDHDKLASSVVAFVEGLTELKSDNRLLAYRVAVVTGILVFLANVVVKYVKIF